jgi:hypothetical protein
VNGCRRCVELTTTMVRNNQSINPTLTGGFRVFWVLNTLQEKRAVPQ